MPASDEFPRGLTLNTEVSTSTAASVTFPALGDLAWVVTNVKAKLFNGNTSNYVTYSVQDAMRNYFYLEADAPQNPNTIHGVDSDEWTGQYKYPIGVAVTISFSGSTANIAEFLEASAFPV